MMQDIRIDIKPLSVNEAWRGRRFKTDKYERYERALLFMLPRINLPNPPFQVYYEFGLSNAQADYDNPCKEFQDTVAKKYGFNDNEIYLATIRKVVVKRGHEYIKFRIEHYDGPTRI